jgi:hypothetical protein
MAEPPHATNRLIAKPKTAPPVAHFVMMLSLATLVPAAYLSRFGGQRATS